jgi:Nif-specific regulatory protein
MKALRECNWIMSRAAKTLGITERMIGYKIRKYGIRTREVHWAVDSGKQHQERGQ